MAVGGGELLVAGELELDVLCTGAIAAAVVAGSEVDCLGALIIALGAWIRLCEGSVRVEQTSLEDAVYSTVASAKLTSPSGPFCNPLRNHIQYVSCESRSVNEAVHWPQLELFC